MIFCKAARNAYLSAAACMRSAVFLKRDFKCSPRPCHWYWAECSLTGVVCTLSHSRCSHSIFAFILAALQRTEREDGNCLCILLWGAVVEEARWPTQEGITSKLNKSTNGHQPRLPSLRAGCLSPIISARWWSAWISIKNLQSFDRFPPPIAVHLLSACQYSFSNQSAGCRTKSLRDFFSK